jgi:hypothetical protein
MGRMKHAHFLVIGFVVTASFLAPGCGSSNVPSSSNATVTGIAGLMVASAANLNPVSAAVTINFYADSPGIACTTLTTGSAPATVGTLSFTSDATQLPGKTFDLATTSGLTFVFDAPSGDTLFAKSGTVTFEAGSPETLSGIFTGTFVGLKDQTPTQVHGSFAAPSCDSY